MSERFYVTDAWLEDFARSDMSHMRDLARELIERRALDLTDEERDALVRIRNDLRNSERRSPDVMYHPAHLVEARRALDKLLKGAK